MGRGRRIFLAGLLGVAIGSSAVASNAKPNLRQGLWRVDIEMTLPGKGPKEGGPIVQEVCLNDGNLSHIVMPTNPFCKGNITRQTPKEMDWRMQCSQGGTDTLSKAHFEFVGEKFAGAILTTAPRFNMEFKTIIRGEYLRACSAAQAREALPPVQNRAPANPKSSRPTPEPASGPLAPYQP